MLSRYGFSLEVWDEAKQEMRNILIEKAKELGMISYSELVQRIKVISLEPDSYALGSMLGEISIEEDDLGRGMLSVLVIHKSGDMQPGPGFFELAKKLGRDTSDKLKCWSDEFKKVYAYWSNI